MKSKFAILLIIAFFAANAYGQDGLPDNGRAWVNVPEINVRAAPTRNSDSLGTLAEDTELIVHGREDIADNGLWVYITPVSGGVTGWMLADFLRFPVSLDLNALPVMASSGGSTTVPETEPTPAPVVPEGAVAGTTTAQVNFRTGPGTSYSVISRLARGTTVIVTGRNSAGTWLRVNVNGQEGWLSSSFVTIISGSVESLPVTDAATSNNSGSTNVSVGPAVVPTVGGRAHRIFLAGQRLGNRADVFSKVGDSITATSLFLTPIGVGGLQLGGYTYLQPVVDYFSQSIARTHNSFANESLAARGGWTSGDLLDTAWGEQLGCPGQSPLVCEYSLVRPSVALIMIGTNDILLEVSNAQYQANLETIVQTTIDMGIIPVISTIPDNTVVPGRVAEINAIIINVASAYNIPLWNYWSALQGLPGVGISGDGVHPSAGPFETGVFTPEAIIYGYNVRNLTALMVLDAVWRGALY